jgi:hypothetical protein
VQGYCLSVFSKPIRVVGNIAGVRLEFVGVFEEIANYSYFSKKSKGTTLVFSANISIYGQWVRSLYI